MQVSTLRPGLLVSVNTRVKGGTSYRKTILEEDHLEKDGTHKARWETERTVIDKEEDDLAAKVRLQARADVVKCCAISAFGLLCPESKADLLEEGVKEAQKRVNAFNMKARTCRIQFFFMTGKIAADDVIAVQKINSEIRMLLADMQEGIKNTDPTVIREAAKRAASVGKALTVEAQGRIQEAINTARSVASQIVKSGESAAKEVEREAMKTLKEARTAFLDLDEAKTIAKPKASNRAVDLTPAKGIREINKALKSKERALEL